MMGLGVYWKRLAAARTGLYSAKRRFNQALKAERVLPRMSVVIALFCFAGASSQLLVTINEVLFQQKLQARSIFEDVNRAIEYGVVGFVFLVLRTILLHLSTIENALFRLTNSTCKAGQDVPTSSSIAEGKQQVNGPKGINNKCNDP